jgi:hypothetical protein
MHDMSDRRPRRFRTLARPTALLLVAGLAILFTACGGSGSAATTSTSTTAGSSNNSRNNGPSGSSSFTAYRNCLSQHGVTLPNFRGGARPGAGGTPGEGAPTGSGTPPRRGGFGGFANNPKDQAAEKACASLRPKGGFGGFGRGGGFNSAAGAAYRNCLKLHGVTLPSGTPSGSPSSTISSSTFRAAATACAALRPTPTTTPSAAG